MAVNLSIKNVPDEVVDHLRARARANRRSLQGELLALVEREAGQPVGHSMTVRELHDWARRQGFSGTGDSAADIRRMRDERTAHIERLTAGRPVRRRKAAGRPSGRR